MAKSYNGWTASRSPNEIGIENYKYRGKPFPSGIKSGDVTVVFDYLINALATRVESFNDGYGCWGYYFKMNVNNPDQISCHGSGTAIDWRAPDHPNGKGFTWSPKQVKEIRKILAELRGVIRWLEGYDEMHFEICKGAAAVKAVARDILAGRLVTPIPTGGDVMALDAGAKKEIQAMLNESEAQIMAATRNLMEEVLVDITGGVRTRDAEGNLIDKDAKNVSNADLLTAAEKNTDRIVEAIKGLK